MLSDDKLDELFVKEIAKVTKIVEKLPENDAIVATCTRWFQIFQKAKQEEKFERNYILLMLHKQLNESNALGFPFTGQNSCQNDLRTVYQWMSSANSDSIDEDSYNTSSSIVSFASDSTYTSEYKDDSQQLIDLNCTLKKELQELVVKRENLLRRREICLIEIEKLRNNSKMFHKDMDYIYKSFSSSFDTALNMLAETKLSLSAHPPYFRVVFKDFCEGEQDKEQIQKLDQLFWQLLRVRIDHSTRKIMWHQLTKVYDNLRAKVSNQYKEIIKEQEDSQLQDLSKSRVKFLLVLKKLFMATFKGDTEVKRRVIIFLDKQCNALERYL